MGTLKGQDPEYPLEAQLFVGWATELLSNFPQESQSQITADGC